MNKWLKETLLFSLILFVGGCVTTKGISDTTNNSKEPIEFIFSGTKLDLLKTLKPKLILFGFNFEDEDTTIGILTTKPKILNDDERFDSPMFASAKQYGLVSFIYEHKTDTTLKVLMVCKIHVDFSVAVNKFQNNEQAFIDNVIQGHPLPMKLKKELLNTNKFILIKTK